MRPAFQSQTRWSSALANIPLLLAAARQYLDNIMIVVARVTGTRVAGKNHADETFFYRDRIADFQLRFIPAARDPSMWCVLHPSNCGATVLSRLVEK